MYIVCSKAKSSQGQFVDAQEATGIYAKDWFSAEFADVPYQVHSDWRLPSMPSY
jgi:hypothetical protein